MNFPEAKMAEMDRKPFYREQAEKFLDYKKRFYGRDLLSLFEEWTESKDFSDEDKHKIWQIVRCLTS